MAGLLSLFSRGGMDEYVEKARATDGAVIVDVRGPSEFAQGHVEGALNIPGPDIARIADAVPDKSTPLFVYCLSGHRSGAAVRRLSQMGYANVTNMGGVARYSGPLVRDAR